MCFWETYHQARKLLEKEDLDLREIGRLLLVLVEALKQELLEIFPPQEKEKRLSQSREKKEVVSEEQEQFLLDFSYLYDYKPKVGRPKNRMAPQMTLKEFFECYIPTHKETNLEERAREILQELRAGTFRLRSISDFLALLWAYQEFDEPLVEEWLYKVSSNF